jgi:peptidoglycan/LPS O-acetylase OafA/YrhL
MPDEESCRLSRRYESLDLWRGLACLMVVVYHAGYYGATTAPLPRGVSRTMLAGTKWLQYGVTLFFVISGYCISATAYATHRQGHGLFVYFQRRAHRIFPPYWTVVLITAGVVGVASFLDHAATFTQEWPKVGAISVIPTPQSLNVWQWLGTLSLTELWRTHLVWRGGPRWLLGQAWTLCYEEQFYAVVGLLLLVTGRRQFHWFFRGALLVTGATVGLRWLPGGIPYQAAGTFLDGAWFSFAAGILVYYDLNAADLWARRVGRATLLLVLAWAAWTAWPVLAIASAFALTLVALSRWDRPVVESAWSRPLRLCGVMCYSLYLVHWPVVKLLTAPLYDAGVRSAWATLTVTIPVTASCSLFLAWGFHRMVERRFLNAPMMKTREADGIVGAVPIPVV